MTSKIFLFHHFGHLNKERDWSMRAHHHAFHEMIFVFRGNMDIHFSDAKVHASAGDVLFYHAGIAHEEFAIPPAPLETFFLGFETSRPFDEIPRLVHDKDGRIRVIVNWLFQDRDLPEPWGTNFTEDHFRMLLAEIERLKLRRQHSLIMRTRQFIRDNMDQPLTLDELANHAGISKYHFARRYRGLSGRTPAEEVRLMRLEFARNLLLTSNLPLKAIAPKVGIGDVYQLSRMLRKYLNLSSRDLRNNGRHSQE